ncbi:MAG: mannosyltransferase, partial [Actinomycetota bacterium]
MIINKSLRIALIVTLVASFLAFGKFSHCRSAGWGSPDVYIHMCYSDISALYGAREINTDQWPYASADNSVEYPVLTGIVMWATGLAIDNPDGYKPYFDLNIALIILLLFASVFLLWHLKPVFTPLFPIAPAVFGSLFINWDIYAVLFALASLHFYHDKKFDLSAIFMGIAISTKFYPGVILFGIALIFWNQKR